MNKKYLTLEQNICAARIFLNTFGLTLENINDIDEFSKIKILDKTMNVVGKLHFKNGKVIMSANYNSVALEASFDISNMFGFIDMESNNALFLQWSSKIVFQVQKKNNVKLSGEFLIENSADSEFGLSCLCCPLINYEIAEKGKITLKMLRNSSAFYLEIVSGENSEVIDIRPSNYLNEFLLHDIKNGKYDEEKKGYPYRRYAKISDAD